MSTLAQQIPASTASLERRFYPRIVPRAPLFIALDETTDCLLLNVSENGLLVSAPVELACNFVARIAIPLNGLPKPVQVNVRVVWASEARKLAGIQLLDLAEHDRQLIRKWGAQESAQFRHAEPHLPAAVPGRSAKSSESPHAALPLSEEVPFNKLLHIAPPAPPSAARKRSTSYAAGIAMFGVLGAAVCLAAMLLVKNGAQPHYFARSLQFAYKTSAAAPPAQDIAPSLPYPDATKLVADRQVASLAPSTADQSQPGANPTASGSAVIVRAAADSFAPAIEAPETPLVVPDPPAATGKPIRNLARANDVAAGAHATIPSSPLVASTRFAPPLNSNPPVIQLDAPARQVLEIHLPSGYYEPFLNLPGERVFELPSATLHIQRSVRLPTARLHWPSSRNKQVVIGGLISRVDPQAAQVQPVSGDAVRVRASVTTDGYVERVTPLYGPPNLVRAVVQAVRQWQYQPTLLDGKPAETQCDVVVQFRVPATRTARK
jgi:hypothetical protein